MTRTDDDRFRVELAGGHAVVARRVLAATGLVDELPDIDGLAEHWGGDVIHCPFCHGYEVRDRRIVQIVTHPMGLHPAGLFRQLTARLTLVLHDGVDADDPEVDALRAAGVDVVDGPVRRIVTGDDGHVAAVELADGDRIDADAVAVGPRFQVRAEPFASLGLTPAEHPSGLGDFVETDATGADVGAGPLRRRQRDRPEPAGAAGRRRRQPGRRHDQLQPRRRRHRGRGPTVGQRGRLGSPLRRRPDVERQPERHARHTRSSGLAPGRALDVGAGEGGDAVWLAEQGWKVTASDISQRALDRIAAEAERRGLPIECLHADANALDAFETGAFDLVSAQYASIPRTPDGRGVAQPARRGRSRRHAARRRPRPRADARADRHARAQPAVRPRRLRAGRRLRRRARRLARTGTIEVHEKRPRPPGAASASHHVDDVVLRARRVDARSGSPRSQRERTGPLGT